MFCENTVFICVFPMFLTQICCFYLRFSHVFDSNLPTTPSVNWKICSVSLLFRYPFTLQTWHAPQGKEGNMASIPLMHQPRANGVAVPSRKCRPLRKRKAVQVRNPRLKDVAAPVQRHGIKVCVKQRHASNTCSYLEIRSHCS